VSTTPIREFHDGLKKHFGMQSHDQRKEYLEQVLVPMGLVKIDILRLDDFLHEKYPNYEEELGLSMEELLDQKYSVEASRFVKSFI